MARYTPNTRTKHLKFLHCILIFTLTLSALPLALFAQPAQARQPMRRQCDPNDPEDCLPPTGGRRGMQPGFTYVYALQTVVNGTSTNTNNGTTEAGVSTGVLTKTQQNTTTLTAEAHFTAIRWQPDQTLLIRLIVTDTLVKHTDENGQLSEVPSRTHYIASLAAPVYFERAPDGEITRFLYLPNDDTNAVNTKRGIVMAFRVRLGEEVPEVSLLESRDGDTLGVTGDQVQYALKTDKKYTVFRLVRPNTFLKKISESQDDLTQQETEVKAAIEKLAPKQIRVHLPMVLQGGGALGYATQAQQAWQLDPGDSPEVGSQNFEQNSDSQVQVHNETGVVVNVGQEQGVGSVVLNGDAPEDPSDGNTVVSAATSDTQLNILRTENATDLDTIPSNEVLNDSYHIGLDMEPVSAGGANNPPSTQPTTAAEALDKLRSEPEKPETLMLLTDALKSDALKSEEAESVYNAKYVISYLEDDSAPPAGRKTVIGALVSVGTSRAQQLLNSIGLNEGRGESNTPSERQRDVLIGMATLAQPSDETLMTLQSLSASTDYPLREQAQLTLAALTRTGNAPENAIAMQPQNPTPINFSRSWTKRIGRGFAWGELHGEVQAQSTITIPNTYFRALGTAKGHVFGFTRELARAEFTSSVVNTGTNPVTYTRSFSGYVSVFGNTVTRFSDISYGCNLTRTGDLLPIYNRTFFSVGKTFWISIVPVRLEASMSGFVGVKYAYTIGACNAPLQAMASITLTPQTGIAIRASAQVQFLWLLKAGVAMNVDVLKNAMPIGVRGEYQLVPAPARWEICAEGKLSVHPLSGRLYVWLDRRKYWLFGSWKHHEWTLWRFDLWPYETTLFRGCAS